MTPTSAPVFPAGRYGHRREPAGRRRWLIPVLLVPVVLAALWITFTLWDKYGHPTFSPSTPSAVDVTDTSVTVRFTVTKDAGQTGSCRVRARDYSGSQVGYAEVPVGTGSELTISYPLPTTARAYAVDILGCTAS